MERKIGNICNFGQNLKVAATKLLQKSGIRKNVVIELIYRGFI